MMPIVLSYDHPDTAAAVEMALETGQTLIFPTDTVYGIGGNPWDERTLNHVCRLKEREPDQPFTLHLWSISEIETYAHCEPAMLRIIEQLLPGPYTLLLPAGPRAPKSAVLEGKIGIRVPDHPFFASVLRRPVFATSVNRHDAPPLNDVGDIIENFTEVDLIITGDVSGESSAILDLTQTPYRVVRGSLSEAAAQLLKQE
jgi:L-threonylcarbamoyladenylate synthase